ncbi:MAG: ATP-dependent Clp protease proteolytic subunit [Sandaracinaceae bacterium]
MTEPSPALPSAIDERLFTARTVLVFGEITAELAERTAARLLGLAASSDDPIRVVLSSPGGHVESGDVIHDVIRFIVPEVSVLGTGWVASAGALIFAACPRERRFALPNTRFLLHEPSGGFGGTAADIEIEARQVAAMRDRLHRIFADATGRSIDAIAADLHRNHWMSAEDAVRYGLVGRIVTHAAQL